MNSDQQDYPEAPYQRAGSSQKSGDIIKLLPAGPNPNQIQGNIRVGQSSQLSGFDYQAKTGRVSQIDSQLKRGWPLCYKGWIIFLQICSFIGIILGVIAVFTLDDHFLYCVAVLDCAWNIRQFHDEFKALEDQDVNKGRAAMQSFKVYIIVMPLVFVLAGIIENQSAGFIAGIYFGNVAFFYFLILLPAHKILKRLRERDDIEKDLEASMM